MESGSDNQLDIGNGVVVHRSSTTAICCLTSGVFIGGKGIDRSSMAYDLHVRAARVQWLAVFRVADRVAQAL